MGKQTEETKRSMCITLMFIIVVIIIKSFAIDIAIKYSEESNQCAYDYNGYLDECTSNDQCVNGYICSTDNKCYCDQDSQSNRNSNTNLSCTSNDQCLNGQVCSIETNTCEYTETCEEEKQKVPGMSLSTWLLSWAIIGLCFCIICLIPVYLEKILCNDGNDDCLSGTCLCASYCLGVMYAIFSIID